MAQTVKNPPTMQETLVQSLGWEDTLEKGMVSPLQYSYLENLMDREAGQAIYSPWGWKELDTTEQLTLSLSFPLKALGLAALFGSSLQRGSWSSCGSSTHVHPRLPTAPSCTARGSISAHGPWTPARITVRAQ